ncbi:MAG TPA: OstA-like protein [Puia sp.]|nr:OstA-like protein [Puia sp.]
MKRIVLGIVALLFINFYALAQIPVQFKSADSDTMRTVYIWHADKLREETKDSAKFQSLIGNVKMQEDKTFFYCDSVVMNHKENIIEAFGKVHINDSDTTNIFSDYMKYFVDKKYVIFQKNVKMTDGNGTLFTDDMQYDMKQKIGTYVNGGKVINGTSVLTSKEGVYYAETKDVYFKKNVYLKDPSYDLKTDSLLYNTKSQLATFIMMTHIKDSSGNTIDTKEGIYDLKNHKARFGKRPTIRQGTQRITGDNVQFDDVSGISLATGNAVFVDDSEKVSVLGNRLLADRKANTFFATENPLMIIKQEDDSLYVTADTLFSAKLSDLMIADSIRRHNDSVIAAHQRIRDSIRNDSIRTVKKRIADSLRVVSEQLAKENKRISDSAELAHIDISDSVFLRGVIAEQISLKPQPEPKKGRGRRINAKPPPKDSVINTLGIKELKNKDSTNISPPKIDSLSARKNLDSTKNNLAVNRKNDSTESQIDSAKNIALQKDSVKKRMAISTVAASNDSVNRYLQGYHHVRIFSDSLQGIADSLFYSGKDSVFQLFTNPVVWANGTQITGDTMYLFTKNKKPSRLLVFENALVVNKVGDNLYNQLKGTTINVYFKDGVIDYVRAKGNAESIYYAQDDDKAFFGVNQSKADVIDLIFITRELNKVILRNDAEGTMYPIKKVNFDEMRLRNFKWLEDKRPKTKYELFGQ